MDEQKVLNLLHMARKAGKVQMGFDACERSCSGSTAKLLIVAEDLAEKKKTKLKVIADAYNVKFLVFSTKEKFGQEFKTRDLGVICVEDVNFSKGIVKCVSPLLKKQKK